MVSVFEKILIRTNDIIIRVSGCYESTYNDDIFTALTFSPSKVGQVGVGNVYDESIRKSYTAEKEVWLSIEREKIMYDMERLYRLLPRYLCYKKFEATDFYWTALKYEAGCYFGRHADGRKSNRHFATLLLLPPKKSYPHSGGVLKLYDGEKEYCIDAHQYHWTLIGFPVGVEHEVTDVKAGIRYVLKTEYELKDDEMSFVNHAGKEFENPIVAISEKHEEPDKKTIEEQIDEIEEQIGELQVKKLNLQSKLENLDEANSDIDDLVEAIVGDNSLPVSILVLTRYYENPVPEALIGSDVDLFNDILRRITGSRIKFNNVNVQHNLGDDINFPPDEDRLYFPVSVESCSIHYQKQYIGLTSTGKIEAIKSEYNDQTYDTVHYLNVTLMFIIRPQ